MGTCSSHGDGGQALRRPTGLDIVPLWTHQITFFIGSMTMRERERTGGAGGGRLRKRVYMYMRACSSASSCSRFTRRRLLASSCWTTGDGGPSS